MESPYPIPVPAADILPSAAEVRYRLHVRQVEIGFLRRLLKLLQSAEDQAQGAGEAPRLMAFTAATDAACGGVARA